MASQVKSAPHTVTEAADPRAVRRLAIAASPKVKQVVQVPLTLDKVKERVEALNSEAKDLLSARKRHKVEAADAAQIKIIACVVDLRQKRLALEAQAKAIESDEKAIAEVLKLHMKEREIAQLTSPLGNYCHEPRNGSVSVKPPSDSYIVRT